VTVERGYGKTYGLAEEAKAEREIIRAQPLSHLRIHSIDHNFIEKIILSNIL
jgi:hypothetical protein